MLTGLSIRDVVLIESLDLEFAGGLGVLTGETGAGKSILLDALGLALGARADSALVRAGLDAVREAGYQAVIVLGHPEYYPRFGFSPDLAEKLASAFSGNAFMALELVPGALRGTHGKVTYPAAFGVD